MDKDKRTFRVTYSITKYSSTRKPKWVIDSALGPIDIYHHFWKATAAAFYTAHEMAEKKHYIACPTEGERFWYDVVVDGATNECRSQGLKRLIAEKREMQAPGSITRNA